MTTTSTAVFDPPDTMTEEEAREAIRQMFAQMAEADERIARNQAKIDQLKAETRAMLVALGHTFEEG